MEGSVIMAVGEKMYIVIQQTELHWGWQGSGRSSGWMIMETDTPTPTPTQTAHKYLTWDDLGFVYQPLGLSLQQPWKEGKARGRDKQYQSFLFSFCPERKKSNGDPVILQRLPVVNYLGFTTDTIDTGSVCTPASDIRLGLWRKGRETCKYCWRCSGNCLFIYFSL